MKTINQIGHRHAPAGGNGFAGVFQMVGGGKQQRRQPAIQVKIQRGEDQRGTQAMPERRLASADFCIAIQLAGMANGFHQPIDALTRETGGETVQGFFIDTRIGQGVDNGDHGDVSQVRPELIGSFLSS